MRNKQREVKLLIIDEIHPSFMEILDREDIAHSYQPKIQAKDVLLECKKFNGLVLRSKMQIDKSFFETNPQLEVIARAGSGMDNIDLDYAHEHGIHCINSPEANRDAVGDQTLGMLLALSANIVKGHNEVSKGIWDREGNRGFELNSRTVGIIGFGNTGSAVAKRLAGFGVEIIAYDKYKENYAPNYVQECSLDELQERAEVVSFHVPLTAETKHYIDKTFIEGMKKEFVLLNLSRGGIMCTRDVIEGLKSGKIVRFGTDVLENEKLESHSQDESEELAELVKMREVIVTPHVGGWTVESYRKISEVLAAKVVEFSNGLTSEINPSIYFGHNLP